RLHAAASQRAGRGGAQRPRGRRSGNPGRRPRGGESGRAARGSARKRGLPPLAGGDAARTRAGGSEMKRFFALLLFSATAAVGQTYPSRPVRWIVPFPPGGATDILARIVAQKMTESWRVAVVGESRAGAAGAIGSDAVAKAAPDGHTILMGTTS